MKEKISNLQNQLAVYKLVQQKIAELKNYCEGELSTVLHEGAIWEELINMIKSGASLHDIEKYCEEQQKHLLQEIVNTNKNGL